MEQPPHFVASMGKSVVNKKKKSLCGFKQSPWAWFGKLSQAIEKFGVQKSKSDHYVFYRQSDGDIILLVVYVDNIVITSSDSRGILSLKSFFHTQLYTKDLGILKYFLGVRS